MLDWFQRVIFQRVSITPNFVLGCLILSSFVDDLLYYVHLYHIGRLTYKYWARFLAVASVFIIPNFDACSRCSLFSICRCKKSFSMKMIVWLQLKRIATV